MPYRGLPSTPHRVQRENDEIGCALVSERVPSKGKEEVQGEGEGESDDGRD